LKLRSQFSRVSLKDETVQAIISLVFWAASANVKHLGNLFLVISDELLANITYSALLLEAFRVLSVIPSAQLASVKDIASRKSPIGAIRHLLNSQQPNEQYLFVTCLGCIEPQLWAGTDPTMAPVLDAWEVERVMHFLDSRDPFIRKKVRS
jgi:hypothetical protein